VGSRRHGLGDARDSDDAIAKASAHLPRVQERFLRISQTSGHPVRKIKTIVASTGEPVFDVYRQRR
jgi:hypothetical protein